MLSINILDIHSADVDDLKCWAPISIEDFHIGIEIDVTIEGYDQVVGLQAELSSPEGLRKNFRDNGACEASFRAMFIYRDYNWGRKVNS